MLRVFMFIAAYFLALRFVSGSPLYEQFHAAVVEGARGHMQLHLIGYGCTLIVGSILALLIEYRWKAHTYATAVLLAVFRIGLIGGVMASAYQLFQFFTGGELSVFVLTLPIILILAELAYEFVEFVLDSLRKLFKRATPDAT